MYINTHSYFSLRYGTIKPKDLLQLAQNHHVKTLALTDINNTSASLDFVRLAAKFQIHPVLGVDFRNGAKQQFVMLARNNQGYQQINVYLSNFLHQQKMNIPERASVLADTFVIYPFHSHQHISLESHEYLGVKPTDLNHLRFSEWNKKRDKLVALQTVTVQRKIPAEKAKKHSRTYSAHRLLRAIDNNTLLSRLEASEQGSPDDIMLPKEEMEALYQDFPELITNAETLLSQCSVTFDFSKENPKNKKSYTGNEVLDFKFVKKLCYDGLKYRYRRPGKRIFTRLEKELDIIKEKQFVSYFLINWKMLKYARSKGYFYVGRGSGANSIVAYLLRITDVDPVELDLYFERFINIYRKNPPDFDIDFSWRDRDDVIAFIFNRFPNTALISVYNTFKYKASVRELGKVFGLPKQEIDMLSRGNYNFERLDKLSKLVVVYAKTIEGFPNYLGIHAGGIVISEEPIQQYTATFLPPKGLPTTQFDMIVAEDIGLYKFDVLSQRGLGKIKDAVEIVNHNYPKQKPLDIHDIRKFKHDERIKHILRTADAIGCFYVESPAMRMLLKKLQVDHYLGLVAASSIIRPGVAKSGMMREFILRYRYPERIKDAHPVLLDIMPETYGVMVYQEDVIKVAHYFAGLDLGEADVLRRGMSGKFRGREEFTKVRAKYFANCEEKGHPDKLAKEVWRQIESFAGYAFAKGHSASYAVESYQCLFLKAYYPMEYMVATINNSGGFYTTEFYVHEARMKGANIHAPCINNSNKLTRIEGIDIYLGFLLLKSLEGKAVERLLYERKRHGIFESLDDFIDRVAISVEQVTILIKVDAFRFTGKNKRELLWQMHMTINKTTFEEHVILLFKTDKLQHKLPELVSSNLENAFDDIEHLGFSLCNAFDLLVDKTNNTFQAKDLPQYINKVVTINGYLVTTKTTKTSRGDMMQFGTFVDYNGDYIDTVHFPQVTRRYPFRGRSVYKITGKAIEEFDCINIEVTAMERLPMIEDPRYADSEGRQKLEVGSQQLEEGQFALTTNNQRTLSRKR